MPSDIPEVFDPNEAYDPAKHVIAVDYAAEEHRDVFDIAERKKACGTLETAIDLCFAIALQKTDFNDKVIHFFSAKNTLISWDRATAKTGPLVHLGPDGRVEVDHRSVMKRLNVIASSGGKRTKVQPDADAIMARAWWCVGYWISAVKGISIQLPPAREGSAHTAGQRTESPSNV